MTHICKELSLSLICSIGIHYSLAEFLLSLFLLCNIDYYHVDVISLGLIHNRVEHLLK